MRNINNRNLFFFLVILSLVDVTVYFVFRSKSYFDFLNWNLFLAWIPFVLSSVMYFIYKRKPIKSILVLLGGLWLLFFPNSPYVVTDLIHVTVMKHTYVENGNLTFTYWFDFLVIMLYAWTSLVLGAVSMYQIQNILMNVYNKLISWCFVIITSLAGGYGILLGREYRLNSWEAITDWKMVVRIISESLTSNSLLFCILFGLFIGCVYVTFYFLINREGK